MIEPRFRLRSIALPALGVADSHTALIIGLAGAVDFALFYVSGQIMDRFGRLWSAVPSMIGLAAGHLTLALTHDSMAAVGWFIAAALILSLTLGADLADPRKPAPFLGAWRFTGDVGNAATPLAISAITAAASIAVASGVMAVLGLVGAAIVLRCVRRSAEH